jgi:hypothetical protein
LPAFQVPNHEFKTSVLPERERKKKQENLLYLFSNITIVDLQAVHPQSGHPFSSGHLGKVLVLIVQGNEISMLASSIDGREII